MSKLFSIEDINNRTGHNKSSNSKISESEMIYRGEVYRWGQVQEEEKRNVKQCVIVIQNGDLNNMFDETIVLLCTTDYEQRALVNFSFQFDYEIMPDFNLQRIKDYSNKVFFVSRLKEIKRNELGRYLGTLDKEFMSNLQQVIDFFFGLKRSRNVNKTQMRILSKVDIDFLFGIVETGSSNKRKIARCLELFGFDLNEKGVDYLSDAIWVASGLLDYNVDILAEYVAELRCIDEASEIARLIIARVKENFGFKKAPTIDFIRLIDSLLR